MTEQSPLLVRHLRELARHMAWADETVWNAVQATPQGMDDPKIADTLHHIHLVQHIFLQAWTGAPFEVRERSQFATSNDIAAWGMEARRGVLNFVEGVSFEHLEQGFRMPWAAFFEQQAQKPAAVHTLGESILQVFLHSQHHRGQVCVRLREVGGVPPTVDFILWLWSGRPSQSHS
jgi:uncharacterized damage-inducible protein DinB